GRRVLEVYGLVPLFQSMGLEFAILTYGGRLSITAIADPELVPNLEWITSALCDSHAALKAAFAVGTAPPRRVGLPSRPRVADLMTREVITIAPETSLARAFGIMRRQRFRHLPVVDDRGRLVGLVTHRDLLAASTSSLEHPTEEERVELLRSFYVDQVMETH